LIVGPLQAFIFLTLGAITSPPPPTWDDHGDDYGSVGPHPEPMIRKDVVTSSR
jgi:hypothetical protein